MKYCYWTCSECCLRYCNLKPWFISKFINLFNLKIFKLSVYVRVFQYSYNVFMNNILLLIILADTMPVSSKVHWLGIIHFTVLRTVKGRCIKVYIVCKFLLIKLSVLSFYMCPAQLRINLNLFMKLEAPIWVTVKFIIKAGHFYNYCTLICDN